MKKIFVLLATTIMTLNSCQNNSPAIAESHKPASTTTSVHPAWARHAAIYEVNIRQYTPAGTINAFAEKLPELKKLGVKILWIMPIQPIGKKNRKGSLGSYYSIQDYTSVNPEFGTLEDFKSLVNKAHAMGFKIILDWVANHTAWDAVWMKKHPEWYSTDSTGNIISPVADWADVADLNYDKTAMRNAMFNAMKYWLKETDIDGFRCDVAMMVPIDFWNRVRAGLDSIKPVFMLAETEGPEFHDNAFDMTYGWELHHLMNEVAQGKELPTVFDQYLTKVDSTYPAGALHMYFTTNHDENSWNGTVFERMPKDYKAMFVLAATFPHGMPLIYSGQEYGLHKRLRFFDKDTISASDSSLFDFYSKVIALKNTHPALVNEEDEGDFLRITGDANASVYGFMRQKNGASVLVLLNFTNAVKAFHLPQEARHTAWTNIMTDKPQELSTGDTLTVKAHDFILLASTK